MFDVWFQCRQLAEKKKEKEKGRKASLLVATFFSTPASSIGCKAHKQ